MMLLALVLVAAPIKVATTDWTFSGVDKAVGEAILDRFTSQLAERGVQVTTPRDIQQVLGIERQKQLTGCADGSSCLAELAGALGVDAVLSGTVVKVGTAFTVSLRAIAAGTGKQLATATERLKSEDAVQEWLDTQAHDLPERIRGALATAPDGPPVTTEASGGPVSRRTRLLPAILGGVLAIGGALCLGLSRVDAATLMAEMPSHDPDVLHGARVRGEALEKTGIALMSVGILAVAAGVVWVLLGPASASVALAWSGGRGAFASFGGAWP